MNVCLFNSINCLHCETSTKRNLGKLAVIRNFYYRLASVGILGKEREPEVGKLGWHGNFDTRFERLFRSKSRV